MKKRVALVSPLQSLLPYQYHHELCRNIEGTIIRNNTFAHTKYNLGRFKSNGGQIVGNRFSYAGVPNLEISPLLQFFEGNLPFVRDVLVEANVIMGEGQCWGLLTPAVLCFARGMVRRARALHERTSNHPPLRWLIRVLLVSFFLQSGDGL